MTIITADTVEHFATIERLARRIVPEFYATFFGRPTGEYLVESGHTAVALAIQADRGYRHFLIEHDGSPVGYFSLAPGGSGDRGSSFAKAESVLLRHFYVLAEFRGKGLGQLAMHFIDGQVAKMGARRIELFVLRENSAAVGLYRKNGFIVVEEVLTRLGNGAVLEDYLMRKEVEN
ncbi:MAG TPA: GNAT family N-acetyltransferase [Puia sp.]|nr:GNAT family N-acetyltransferase [Puia sp.]